MKTGIIRIAAIYIDCPNSAIGCGGGVEADDGSFMLDQINAPNVGTKHTCSECGLTFKIPARFKTIFR